MDDPGENNSVIGALYLLKRTHPVVERSEVILKRIVGQSGSRRLDAAGRDVDCGDMMPTTGEFEGKVTCAAADIENLKMWVAPKALIEIFALYGAAQVRNKSRS